MVPGLLIKALEQLVSIKWGLGDGRPGLGIITDVGEAGARLCLSLLAFRGRGMPWDMGQKEAIPAVLLDNEGQTSGQQSRWKRFVWAFEAGG